MEVTAFFQPNHARQFEVVAWCDVEGRAVRLPVTLRGSGLGPQAVFSYDTLDIGAAYINTPHHYEVELMNRWGIPLRLRGGAAS